MIFHRYLEVVLLNQGITPYPICYEGVQFPLERKKKLCVFSSELILPVLVSETEAQPAPLLKPLTT